MKNGLRVTDNPTEQNEYFFAQDAPLEKRSANVSSNAEKNGIT